MGALARVPLRTAGWLLPVAVALGATLAALQPAPWMHGFLGFSSMTFLGLLGLSAATRSAGGGRTLLLLVGLALVLRLGTGIALHLGLPSWGYDEPDDQAGFVYTDAHRRDAQAWDLAASDHSLLEAFRRKYYADQYGGLLALSALIFRLFSADVHRPMMLILVTALSASAALPFAWRAVGELWGARASVICCTIFALYPETVLLGSSAMREPYLITLSAMMFWGFVALQRSNGPGVHRSRTPILWLAGAGIAMMLISPAALLANGAVLLVWRYLAGPRPHWRWGLAVSLALAISIVFLSWSLDRRNAMPAGTPIGVVATFLRQAVERDVYQLERGSGWVQKLFDEMPETSRLPFVTAYGILQPVLPAALVEPTTPVWQVIAIARAAGWYAFLPLLVLGLAFASRWKGAAQPRAIISMTWISWGWIILAALRGGADQWDNPRYRAILFIWQAVVATHVWLWWRESRSPWLVRAFAMELALVLVFGQWYLSRYLHVGPQWPFTSMVAGVMVLWITVVFSGWLWDRLRLTGPRRGL